jgi:hypothetical protein
MALASRTNELVPGFKPGCCFCKTESEEKAKKREECSLDVADASVSQFVNFL